MTSHFVKRLAAFTVMIALGLAGVYLVNKYGEEPAVTATATEDCIGEGC